MYELRKPSYRNWCEVPWSRDVPKCTRVLIFLLFTFSPLLTRHPSLPPPALSLFLPPALSLSLSLSSARFLSPPLSLSTAVALSPLPSPSTVTFCHVPASNTFMPRPKRARNSSTQSSQLGQTEHKHLPQYFKKTSFHDWSLWGYLRNVWRTTPITFPIDCRRWIHSLQSIADCNNLYCCHKDKTTRAEQLLASYKLVSPYFHMVSLSLRLDA